MDFLYKVCIRNTLYTDGACYSYSSVISNENPKNRKMKISRDSEGVVGATGYRNELLLMFLAFAD